MMNERLYKSYQNLTNIIFRISDGTEQGKSRAILLNSHIDSTLPSPGAADDAMAVGIMLDVARVLIQSAPRESWFVGWSIIFCKSFRLSDRKPHSALLYIPPRLRSTYIYSVGSDSCLMSRSSL